MAAAAPYGVQQPARRERHLVVPQKPLRAFLRLQLLGPLARAAAAAMDPNSVPQLQFPPSMAAAMAAAAAATSDAIPSVTVAAATITSSIAVVAVVAVAVVAVVTSAAWLQSVR